MSPDHSQGCYTTLAQILLIQQLFQCSLSNCRVGSARSISKQLPRTYAGSPLRKSTQPLHVPGGVPNCHWSCLIGWGVNGDVTHIPYMDTKEMVIHLVVHILTFQVKNKYVTVTAYLERDASKCAKDRYLWSSGLPHPGCGDRGRG